MDRSKLRASRRAARESRRWRLGPRGAGAAALLLLGAAAPVGEPERIRYRGSMRNIAVLAPATAGGAAPLVLALGEPDRSARYYLNGWREVAEREGLIVAAISPAEPTAWRSATDGSDFLRAVVRQVASRRKVDARRVYLFGVGTGGSFALAMALQQPAYFAAVASFGGDLRSHDLIAVGQLERPLPVGLFVAKRDQRMGVEAMELTAGVLRQSGAVVDVEKLSVNPNFERKGRGAAEHIWEALKSHSLSEAPRFDRSRSDR